jgi:hypothetical protein
MRARASYSIRANLSERIGAKPGDELRATISEGIKAMYNVMSCFI